MTTNDNSAVIAPMVISCGPQVPEPHLLREAPNRDQIEAIIDQYLADQHCTLFGRAYDIISERSRTECIQFLADVVEAVESRRA